MNTFNQAQYETSGSDISSGKEEIRSRTNPGWPRKFIHPQQVKISAAENAAMEKEWKKHGFATSLFSLAGAIHNCNQDGRMRKAKALAFIRMKKSNRKPQHTDWEDYQNHMQAERDLAGQISTLETMLTLALRGMRYRIIGG